MEVFFIMKNLTLLNNDTTFKLNDTGTIIRFKATNDGQPVGIKEGQSANFRIKNELGFLKTVPSTTTYGGYAFELDTSNLSDLVVGTYDVELVVTQSEDDVLIFPEEGFVTLKITQNALNITGEQLPVMSLDDFKQQLKEYVDAQTTELKSDFDTYVASVKTGPQGEPGKDGTNGADGATGPQGEAATVNIGTVSTLSSDQSAYVNNTGSDTDAVLNFGIPKGPQGEKGEKGEKGDTGDVSAYCNSTGWLQTGLVFPSQASDIRSLYKIDTINGASEITIYCSVKFDRSYLTGYGVKVLSLPSNVSFVSTPAYLYIYAQANTAAGHCNVKVKNNDIIINDVNNLESSGLVELNFNITMPVTLNN